VGKENTNAKHPPKEYLKGIPHDINSRYNTNKAINREARLITFKDVIGEKGSNDATNGTRGL
jgi:hypothetical protein